jgi:hypothetical protein
VCPAEVIQRFINRSWRFIDTYRKGLTGEAAAWAVCKQRSHRAVSKSAMKALEASNKLEPIYSVNLVQNLAAPQNPWEN